MKPLKPKYLIIIALIAIGVLCYTMIILIGQNSKCTINPLVYGAKQIEEKGYPFECSCEFESDRVLGFTLNSEGITIKEEDNLFNPNPEFNFTNTKW